MTPDQTKLNAAEVIQTQIAPGERGLDAHKVAIAPGLGSKGKKKQPREITSSFGFKPSSRSSSESATHSDTGQSKLESPSRAGSVSSSIGSNRPSCTTCYLNFDRFDVQIENGRAPSQLLSWDHLFSIAHGRKDAQNADSDKYDDANMNILQAIEWYGWPCPTKFQAVAIPCIVQACLNAPDAKSYTLMQAASGLGKTSALALGILASVQRHVSKLQFVMLALDQCEAAERYLNSLGCLCDLRVAYLKEGTPNCISEDVAAASCVQVLVGHPGRVHDVLKAAQDRMSLEAVQVLLLDDASDLVGDGWVEKICEINQMLSKFARHPLRYVAISNFAERQAKPALRALKSSLMSKKNMFDLSNQVGRIRNCVKHYILHADPETWLQTLMQLRETVYIPRAVIYCDAAQQFKSLKRQFETTGMRDSEGKIMSVAVSDSASQSKKEHQECLRAFCKEQHDFLLTRSEHNIFQSTLPKVFWIVHFGVETSNLSVYGCRLLCLDTSLREKVRRGPHHDGVSILFLPPKDKDTASKLRKMFSIRFEALPFGNFA